MHKDPTGLSSGLVYEIMDLLGHLIMIVKD
jgi:hypothetical protein